MNKLSYINSLLSDYSLSQLDYKVLIELYKQSFLTPQVIADSIESNVIDVISSLSSMQNTAVNLIEISSDKFLLSSNGDDIIEQAAKLWIASERPELLEPTGSRKKREISETMEDFKNYALAEIKGKWDIKDVIVDRSNFLIIFTNRVASVGALEIKNKGEVRVVGRKPSQEIIDSLASIGMKYRVTPVQTYFDIDCSEENISNVINTLNELN